MKELPKGAREMNKVESKLIAI